jgi:urate oxidase
MDLASPRYGKQRVRVLRVVRGPRHEVREATVSVLLEGAFEKSYLSDDNSQVVPTDTIKNTIQILAQEHLTGSIEGFGLALGKHFLGRYAHIASVECELSERVWDRVEIGGKPHPHTFLGSSRTEPFACVRSNRGEGVVLSGVRNLVLMKTTESSFAGYPKCEFTTLAEASDRILATSVEAAWTYGNAPAGYRECNSRILSEMIRVFAETFSPSAQRTLYEMGEAALAAVREIEEITLKLPNKHYLLMNYGPFHRENPGEVFLPTDEPHGEIEATLRRTS